MCWPAPTRPTIPSSRRQVTYDEESPQKPIDIYALTKLLSENVCFAYGREYGLPVTALRYCSIKAANEVLSMLHPAWLNYFIEMTLSNNRIPWFGAEHIEETKAIMSELLRTPDAVCAVSDAHGEPWRLVVTDVRDVVAGTILALEREEAIGEAFNMTGCPPVTYAEAARLLADATGRPYREVTMPFWRGADASTEKARAPARLRSTIFLRQDGGDSARLSARRANRSNSQLKSLHAPYR